MNRAERRRHAKAGEQVAAEKVMQIKVADFEKIKEDIHRAAAMKSFDLMLQVPLEVLKDKFDWSQEELDKFLDFALDLYDSVDRDYVALIELREDVEGFMGLQIRERRSKRCESSTDGSTSI